VHLPAALLPAGEVLIKQSSSSMVQIVEDDCSKGNTVTQCVDGSGFAAHSSSDRHIHFHMHMHASPSGCSPTSSVLQQHHQQPVQQLSLPAASSAQPYPAFVKPSSSMQQRSALPADAAAVQSLLSLACPANEKQQQQYDIEAHPAGTSAILEQQQQQQQLGSSKRRGCRRLRRVLRALLLSGAATAMVLAGAGGAVVLLSPRVEQLEARCSQVGPAGGGQLLLFFSSSMRENDASG
jgi:hypothetical protein